MSRRVLLVGGGSPASVLAPQLAPHVRWVTPVAAEVDDEFVDRACGAGSGGLDLVVHALYPRGSRSPVRLADMSLQQWRAGCDEPLEAGLRLARGAYRHLRARRGVLVFCVPLISSAGAAGFTALAAASEGLRILARSLAKSWGSSGVRVHALALHPAMFVDAEHAQAAVAAVSIAEPALRRPPDAAEIAAVVDFLAAPACTALTGTTLTADGGIWMAG